MQTFALNKNRIRLIFFVVSTTNLSHLLISSFKSTRVSFSRKILSPVTYCRFQIAAKIDSKPLTTSTLSRSIMSDSDRIEGPSIPSISSNTKRIFWVRHGEVINPGGDQFVHYGSLDVELSPLGKEEAKVAGMYLKQIHLSNVYSSQLSRAIYGAEQVLLNQKDATHLQLVKLVGFNELHRGEWTGKTTEEIGEENLKRFNECDESVTPTDGESYRTLYSRVINTRDTSVLSNMVPGTAAAVVSHVQVTRCMVVDALQIPIEQMEKQVSISTASITCIDYVYDSGAIVEQLLRFQSFKPAEILGFQKSIDEAN